MKKMHVKEHFLSLLQQTPETNAFEPKFVYPYLRKKKKCNESFQISLKLTSFLCKF